MKTHNHCENFFILQKKLQIFGKMCKAAEPSANLKAVEKPAYVQ